ncbi:MAG TPA: glycosyltransferase family 9 protein, partial [Methylocella sp.]|nr:glycosyltransferase family 9 protein [Methylocella sp.]
RLIETSGAAEGFSFQCPLMSLPYGFRTGLETVPAPVPYLFAEAALVAKWAGRIGAEGFRIGIGWQGNKFVDPSRSIPLASFAPLAALPGVRLISLMKDQGPLEVEGPNGSFRIESPGRDMDAGPDSFTDCAAAMQTLDLIVTADTAIAHLAGALGRPVFVALKHVPDWRWMIDREDSPWYPTMRLFRQRERGDWDTVFHRIAAAVKASMEGAPGFPAAPGKSAAVISVPSTAGDLIDRIAMLEAEVGRPGEPSRLEAARHELARLKGLRASCGFNGDIAAIEEELRWLNRSILDAEASLQIHRAGEDFGTAAGCLARQLWKDNARRAALKQEINALFDSASQEGRAQHTKPRLEAC